jgi:hypothetical protein
MVKAGKSETRMALKFVKKAAADAGVTQAPATQAQTPQSDTPPVSQKKAPSSSQSNWIKKGAAAKEALAAEEVAAELRKADAGRLYRFRMNEGDERRITFLDGSLDGDGMLDISMYREHMIRLNGSWQNFVCTAEADQTQPCPICDSGDRPSLVGAMTVIDHTPYTVKSGVNAGKTISNTRKLFLVKPQTLKQLTTLAKKRGGLAGCTFDVSRVGDTSASVGNQFDFVEKITSRQAIAEKYGLKPEDVIPAAYDAEIKYFSPQELIALGVGKATKSLTSAAASASVSDEL